MTEPLVALGGIHEAFGGVHAVEDVSMLILGKRPQGKAQAERENG